jgi:hypothetical protein
MVDGNFGAHGNWQRMNLGRVVMGWLAHILSNADCRLNYVQNWAGKGPKMLAQAYAAETVLYSRLDKAVVALQGLKIRRQGKDRLTQDCCTAKSSRNDTQTAGCGRIIDPVLY